MNLVYYYNYVFYTKIIPDDEPHATVVFTLSFTQSWYFMAVADVIAAKLYCYNLPIQISLLVFGTLLVTNYLFYFKSGRGSKLVEANPILVNKAFSIILVLVFEILAILYMFFGAIWIKSMLDLC